MKSDKLSLLSILYLIAWCISPPLMYGVSYRVVAFLAMLYCVISTIRYASPNQRKDLIIIIALSAYMLLVSLVTGESFVYLISTIVFFFAGISFDIWSDNQDNGNRFKTILMWSFILYAIWNTTTFFTALQDERIMRVLVKNCEEGEYYARKGVGGYGYLYSAVIALPVGAQLLRERCLNKIEKLIILYVIITTFIISYLSQYLIAMLLCVLIAFMAWKTPSKNTVIVIAIVAVVVGLCLEPILDYLISIVDRGTTYRKLVDMRDILVNGETVDDSDFGERYERYTRDLYLILTNPLLGTMRFADVGKHSSILDTFAKYGLILGFFINKMIYRPLFVAVHSRQSIAMVSMIVIFILAIMNSFAITNVAPLCFILPSYCKWKNLEKLQ